MTEYHTVKQSIIRGCGVPRRRRACGISGAAWLRGLRIAACLLFYAWQHFECIQIRYQIEQLDSERAQSAELNQQLHLEVATLRSPMRVDAIARNQLGLTVPVPGQMAPPKEPSNAVLAEARAVCSHRVPDPSLL